MPRKSRKYKVKGRDLVEVSVDEITWKPLVAQVPEGPRQECIVRPGFIMDLWRLKPEQILAAAGAYLRHRPRLKRNTDYARCLHGLAVHHVDTRFIYERPFDMAVRAYFRRLTPLELREQEQWN